MTERFRRITAENVDILELLNREVQPHETVVKINFSDRNAHGLQTFHWTVIVDTQPPNRSDLTLGPPPGVSSP